MPSPKAQKIDLNADYPCPCGRKGRLVPIVLTEAFGCNRCQQIFVVEKSEQVIEQLSTTHPYKKAWLWTGSRWYRAHTGLKEHYLASAFVLVVLLPLIWVIGVCNIPNLANRHLWAIIPVVLVELIALIQWLAYRR
ncbi:MULTISPECIES: hypothetical protein [Aerosakkonema]|uniref:hypothetical protein n=1 Tax=Aerosakkonema TaxID=1246629 RepID=UPI0035BB830F